MGQLQNRLDSFYTMFLDHVATGRGRRLGKKAARETEARTYIGQAAVEAGLADAVGTFDEVLHEANAVARKGGSPRSVSTGANAMAILNDAQTVTTEEANRATETARQEGLVAGRREGEQLAYSRLGAIMRDPRAEGRVQIALDLAIRSPSMSADDVLGFIQSLPSPVAPQAGAGTQVPQASQQTTVPPIQQRVEASGANQIQPGMGHTAAEEAQTNMRHAWSDLAAQQNQRFNGQGQQPPREPRR
jgi:hypothetical protein